MNYEEVRTWLESKPPDEIVDSILKGTCNNCVLANFLKNEKGVVFPHVGSHEYNAENGIGKYTPLPRWAVFYVNLVDVFISRNLRVTAEDGLRLLNEAINLEISEISSMPEYEASML